MNDPSADLRDFAQTVGQLAGELSAIRAEVQRLVEAEQSRPLTAAEQALLDRREREVEQLRAQLHDLVQPFDDPPA